MVSSVPQYDPIAAGQINLDPITLIPIFGPAVPQLQTPSGAPINFYVPPPPSDLLPQPPQPASWNDYLPFIVGGSTIVLLVIIYLMVRSK